MRYHKNLEILKIIYILLRRAREMTAGGFKEHKCAAGGNEATAPLNMRNGGCTSAVPPSDGDAPLVAR